MCCVDLSTLYAASDALALILSGTFLLMQRQFTCTLLTYLCPNPSCERSEDIEWFYPLFNLILLLRPSWTVSKGRIDRSMAGWPAVRRTTTGNPVSVSA